jgi:hypothetical protein
VGLTCDVNHSQAVAPELDLVVGVDAVRPEGALFFGNLIAA